jgi:predicted transcriptional regulator
MDVDTSEGIFDTDTKRILESTKDMSKSASQIISECNIAQSTAYKKLKKLAQMNLLRTKHVFREYGKWDIKVICV